MALLAFLFFFTLGTAKGAMATETSVLTACRAPEIHQRQLAPEPHSVHVLGIDIGAAFSKFAVTDANGTAHTVENIQQQRKTPTLLSLRNGLHAVGERAARRVCSPKVGIGRNRR